MKQAAYNVLTAHQYHRKITVTDTLWLKTTIRLINGKKWMERGCNRLK
ncbi:MAG: hypothetical protein ACJASL_001299 [Paraglaciecola sp.]|jgi:hypothetical protein